MRVPSGESSGATPEPRAVVWPVFPPRELAISAMLVVLTVVVAFVLSEALFRALSLKPAELERLQLARGVTMSVLVGLIVAWTLWHRARLRSAALERELARGTREFEEAHALLQTVLDNMPSGMMVLDQDLRILRANRAAERVHGGPVEGRYCFDVLKDSNDSINFPMLRSLLAGDAWALRHYADRRTGEVFEIDHHPIRLPGGQRGVVFMERIVTQEYRALTGLRDSEKRYRSLYENTPMMYFTLDSHGTVLSVNAHGARELGYDSGELVGRPVLGVFHEDDRALVTDRLETFIASGEPVGRWEARKRRKDGSVLSVAETACTMRGVDGEMVILVICEDITARKLSDQRLRAYQRSLRAASLDCALAEERERRRIAIGLHDQVGQMLAIAKLKLSQHLPPGDDRDRETVFRDVHETLDRTILACRSLTFDLSSPVLYELGLEAALQSLGQQLEESSAIRFHFTTDDRPKPVPEELAIIIHRSARELLRNIARHSKARNARMSFTREDDEIRLEIVDDGIGIHTRSQPLSRNGGFGVFSIVEQLRSVSGNVTFSSAGTLGTRVLITAPLTPPRDLDAAKQSDAAAALEG